MDLVTDPQRLGGKHAAARYLDELKQKRSEKQD